MSTPSSLAELLKRWAHEHHVGSSALVALSHVLASYDAAPAPVDSDKLSSEARVQSLVRVEAAQAGYWLTRNNVGAFQDPRSVICVHCGKPAMGARATAGRWIRYGLANESKQQNAIIKSADLIGFRRRVIIGSDVGSEIAQFVSRECKAEGWQPSPNDAHEQAQSAWRDFVNSNGGDAAFVSGPGSFQPRVALPLAVLKR
jgi:hypothetical protein